MSRRLEKQLATATGLTLDSALIVIAIVLVLIAIFVKNKWVKAAVLAYEIFP